MTLQIASGICLGLIVAFAAWKIRALSAGGAWLAALEGAIVFGLGGWKWAVLLLGFFITSSALSHTFKARKQRLDEKFSKGSRRDAGQVLANGGVAAALALTAFILSQSSPAAAHEQLQTILWIAYAGSLAAANADTWATELGVLNRTNPRSLKTFQPVEPGSSGAVSLLGTSCALAGAALIAGLAAAFDPATGWLGFTAIALGGLLGSLFDSLLGATIQAIYLCPTCQKETERHPLHTCGSRTTLIRGWSWLNNDWVNIGCTLIGALAAGLIFASVL
ncbi:MAG: DUF92 domain-containing protein [Anaerolineaceae bacterium]